MTVSIVLVEWVLKKSAADERRGEFSSLVEQSMLMLEGSIIEGSMLAEGVSIVGASTDMCATEHSENSRSREFS